MICCKPARIILVSGLVRTVPLIVANRQRPFVKSKSWGTDLRKRHQDGGRRNCSVRNVVLRGRITSCYPLSRNSKQKEELALTLKLELEY